MGPFNTIIISSKGKKTILHPFMPALATKIALLEGISVKILEVNNLLPILRRSLETGDYVRWDNEKPYDYDDTLVIREVFNLLKEHVDNSIELSFSKKGGVYTYLGGLKTNEDNSVDLVVNLIILDYLLRNKLNFEDSDKLINFLKSKMSIFEKNIEECSKYYLSEGFLVYSLSRVKSVLGTDINKLIHLKISKVNNKTDVGLLILASPTLNEELVRKFNEGSDEPFELFQQKRYSFKFACPYFDKVIRKCAERRIKDYQR